MDAATLYMIVTMPNGEMRTDRFPMETMELCEYSIRGAQAPEVAWCVPERKDWTRFAR